MTHTERRVEVSLAAGRQDDQHTAAGVPSVDLQLRDLDVCFKRVSAVAQPADSRQCVFTVRSNGTVWTLQPSGLVTKFCN